MNAAARRNDPPQELPNNLEAEMALLGAIMVNNEAMIAVNSTGIEPGHFYEPIHQRIFEAMRAGHRAGKNMNPVTVKNGMSPVDAAQPIGGLTFSGYLATLCSEAVSVVNAPDYAKAIIFAAQRRASLSASEVAEVAARHTDDELSFLDKIREARDRFDNIIRTIEGSDGDPETFADGIDATLDQTADAMSGMRPTGLDTGIPELSSLVGPLQPGQLVIIGGDVKVGKSALAWQVFFNIAENHPIAGNSGEMQRAQIIMREKARRTGISAKRQKLGQISESEMQELVRAGAEMKHLKPIDIDCRQLTLEQIDQRIERLQGELGIECFLLDHILKLAWSGRMEDVDDFKKANRATSTLKNIAMKRGLCIVALTHINKGSDDKTYGKSYGDRLSSAKRKRPTFKSMLGNIDKDADNMIIVHQALPAVAALEPEQGTADYALWETAMDDVRGRAELILALSRENEFPRRKDIIWNGSTTSFGPSFKQAQNSRGLL